MTGDILDFLRILFNVLLIKDWIMLLIVVILLRNDEEMVDLELRFSIFD